MLLNRTTFEHHQKKVPIKQALQEALKLNHQMAELTKTSGASPEDLETFSLLVWNTHVATEVRSGTKNNGKIETSPTIG